MLAKKPETVTNGKMTIGVKAPAWSNLSARADKRRPKELPPMTLTIEMAQNQSKLMWLSKESLKMKKTAIVKHVKKRRKNGITWEETPKKNAKGLYKRAC